MISVQLCDFSEAFRTKLEHSLSLDMAMLSMTLKNILAG